MSITRLVEMIVIVYQPAVRVFMIMHPIRGHTVMVMVIGMGNGHVQLHVVQKKINLTDGNSDYGFISMLVMMFMLRQLKGVGINPQPFIDDRDSMRVTMSTHPLLVKGIGRITEAKKHQQQWGRIFQEGGNFF